MPDEIKADAGGGFRASLWLKLMLGVLVALGLVYGLMLVLDSQVWTRSVNQRNFHSLDVASHNLEEWPRDVAGISKSVFSSPGDKFLLHPDFGRLDFDFNDAGCIRNPSGANQGSKSPPSPDQSSPQKSVPAPTLKESESQSAPSASAPLRLEHFEPGVRAGEGSRYVVVGKERAADTGQEFCFRLSVPFASLVRQGFEGTAISHFLIVAADGHIIQQFGDPELPVNRLDALVPEGGIVHSLTTLTKSVDGKSDTSEQTLAIPAGLRDVASTDIAGTHYVAYAKPLAVDSPEVTCPTLLHRRGIKGEADKIVDQCFAVALMPARELQQGWLSPSPVPLILFALAVLIFLALLPLIKLLLICGVEALRPFELAAIIGGIPTTAALVTIGILFVSSVAAHRAQAGQEVMTSAKELAEAATGDLDFALQQAASGKAESCEGGDLGLPKVEVVSFVDEQGKRIQGPGVHTCRNTESKFSDVSFRDYYQAMRLEQVLAFRPNTGAGSANQPAPWIYYTLGQVRAQTDGIDRSVIFVKCAREVIGCTSSGSAENGKAGPAYVLFAFQLEALVAPVLPAPQHFMVIDGSADRMPVLFHTERSHAGVENFLDETELPGARTEELERLAEGAYSNRQTPGRVTFVARYRGKQALFAAAKVQHSHWLVLTWSDVDQVDTIAARAAKQAFTGWIALAAVLFLLVALSVTIRGERWRRAWPHENADALYVHVGNVLGIAGLVALGMLALGWPGAIAALLLAILLSVWRLMPSVDNRPQSFFRLFEWISSRLRDFFSLKLRHLISSKILESSRPSGAWFLMAAAVALVLSPMIGYALWGKVVGALIVMFGAIFYLHLLSVPDDTDDALSQKTERHFMHMVLALVLCVGVVPAAALWQDASGLATHSASDARLHAAQNSFDAAKRRARLIWYSLDLKAARPPVQKPIVIGLDSNPMVQPHLQSASGFIAFWREMALDVHYPSVAICPQQDRMSDHRNVQASHDESSSFFCGIPAQRPAGVFQPPVRGWPWLGWRSFVIFVLTIGAVLALYWLVDRGLRALAGFRVPLGAIKDTGLELREKSDGSECELWPRTLLVAPPQVVVDRISGYPNPKPVDLAEIFLKADSQQIGKHDWIEERIGELIFGKWHERKRFEGMPKPLFILTGLELVLRDGQRRRGALLFCEAAERRLARNELRGLVMIAEMSPLERILDTFETENDGDPISRSVREELRWSRFFQAFTTFTFSPADKLGTDMEFHPFLKTEGAPPSDASVHLANELRWLPGDVIDSTIERNLCGKVAELLRKETRFPVDPKHVRALYHENIADWVKGRKIPTKEAAFDYMRSKLIEHYEQCWVSSTRAERLVLDAIARGNFVNMRNAVALQSLVRRGLVVLDPSPRLMNRSFGLFIQQTQRPDRLESWRLKQHSSWRLSRWAILTVAVAAGVLLIAFAAMAGEDVTALFALFAAAVPALFNFVFNRVRT